MSLQVLRRALEHEATAILRAGELLDRAYATAIEWFLSCQGRVITCGVGKSGHIARKTAGTLSSTGTPSLFLHAAEAVHGDLGMVTDRDIVLMYSHSGETDELVNLFPPIRAIGARVVLMTGRPESSAGRLADLVLNTHVEDEACPNNLAPTTSTTVMLALSDALAIGTMSARGFGPGDFAKFHPAGALGRRLLLRVRDVMRTDSDLALVAPGDPVLQVMRAITQAGAGVACVVDADRNLLGLISDGDLRRHLVSSDSPFEAQADAIMTAHPMTLPPELLAVEALEMLQNAPRKIGEVPVLDGTRVVGVLTLKDLLRSGIV